MKIILISDGFHQMHGGATVGHFFHKYLSKNHEVIKIDGDKLHLDRIGGYRSFLTQLLDYRKIPPNLEADCIICVCEALIPFAVHVKKKFTIPKLHMVGYGTYSYIPFIDFPQKYIYLRALKSVDSITISCRFTINKMRDFTTRKPTFLPLGVDLDTYYPIKTPKKKIFTFVGAPKGRKGFKYLLQAFQLFKKDFSGYKIHLVAKDDPRTRELIDSYGLSEDVHITGRIDHEQLLKEYSQATANILPSTNTKRSFEGFGLVHLEANACGTPSIGSSNSANDDAIVDGKTGFLCKQKDSQDIARAMKIIAGDKKVYAQMCKDSLAFAKKMTWKNCVQKFEQLHLTK